MKKNPLEKLLVDNVRIKAFMVVQLNHKHLFCDLYETRNEAKEALVGYHCPILNHEARIIPVLITDVF